MLASLVLSMLSLHVPAAQAATWCLNNGAIAFKPLSDGSCDRGLTRVEANSKAEAEKIVLSEAQKSAATATLGQPRVETGLTCTISDIANCLANIVYVFTVGLGSGMAYVGGFVFDMTVSLSLNSAAYALDFLSAGWTTARDLANMGFILILVYIAFIIMFQAENRGTMQMLAWVIFIALIINFSFFLTRVVIDAGNILAVQFYNAIDAPTMAGTFGATNANTGALANTATGIATRLGPNGVFENTKDLTAGIMQALNIQELFNDKGFQSFAKESGFGTKFIILSFLYIAVGACYFILAAMFLAIGIKFLVRIVVLWFLIIAAPLAFIARALPSSTTSGPSWYNQWQSELVKHAFYPAVFLFIFLFINAVMVGLRGPTGILGGLATDLNSLSSNADLGSFVIIASAVANVGIRLGFIIAMLYIALKASEKVGVWGAGVAQRATSFAFGQTGRLASAPVGWMGRNTFGRAGNALATTKAFSTKSAAAPSFFGRGVWRDVDRGAKSIGSKLGKGSYDPRNAPGASILKTGAEKITGGGVSAGTPVAGGFIAQVKARDEERKTKEKEEKQKAREEKNQKAIEELAENSAKHDALEAKEKAGSLTAVEQTHKTALKHRIGQIETKINTLNKSEIGAFKSADIQKVLKHLNKEAIKKIDESEKYTEDEKEKIRTGHEEKMEEKKHAETQAKLEKERAEAQIKAEKERMEAQAKSDSIALESVKKSQKIIEELRHISDDLVKNVGILPAALTHLTDAIKPNSIVSSKELATVRQKVRNNMSVINNEFIKASNDNERQRAKHGQEQLKEVMTHLEALEEKLDTIPEKKLLAA